MNAPPFDDNFFDFPLFGDELPPFTGPEEPTVTFTFRAPGSAREAKIILPQSMDRSVPDNPRPPSRYRTAVFHGPTRDRTETDQSAALPQASQNGAVTLPPYDQWFT